MSAGVVPLLLAGLVVMAGSCLQGSTGLGLALVAAPTLALIDPRLVPVPIAAVGLVLLILVSTRERRALNLSGVGWALTGCVPGTIVGALVVAALAGRGITVACGTVILTGVVASVSGWTPKPTVPVLLGAGLASGFMGTTTSAAGPPMGLVYQRTRGAELRASLSAFFVVGNVFSLTTLALFGQVHRFQIEAAGWLLPFTLAGFALSGPARHVLDRGYTRPAILTLAAVSAVLLIAKSLA